MATGSVEAALRYNTTGNQNSAFATGALANNTTGSNNTAVGFQSLLSNTTASNNTAVGYQAAYSNTTASNNTAVGYQAAYTNTTGADNVAVGKGALYTNSTGSFNTAFGTSALTVNTVSYNSAFGSSALAANTTGAENAIFGGIAGFVNTTGSGLTGMGYVALRFNTTGSNNTAIGDAALYSNTTASNNTAVGYQALYTSTTAGQNTAMGYRAGFAVTTGDLNTLIGYNAGTNLTTGFRNTCIGHSTGSSTTTGNYNVFIGIGNSDIGAGSGVTTGSKNVIIGGYSGSAAPISATGSNYIVLSDGDGNVRGTFDSSGNLGIGTTSPVSRLSSVGNSATDFKALTLRNSNGTTGSAAVLNFEASSGTEGDISSSAAQIKGIRTGAGTSGALAFWTSNSGVSAEAMRIDSAGNLGLGVTPSAWSVGKAIEVGSLGNGLWNVALSDTYLIANVIYTSSLFKYANTGAASYYNQNSGKHSWFIAPSGTAGDTITFTQAMTLDASGNLLVGTTSTSVTNGGMFIQPGAGGETYYAMGHKTGTASGSIYAGFYYAGTSIGSISQSGTAAVLYNVTSDERLKENIQDAAPASALIDNLQVRQYNWKSNGSHQRYGFVAQELVTVAPEAVHQPADPEEMMAVDYSKLVPMLVKEIQDLRKRLAALEAK